MAFVVIIPARYASTRLPAKPLADIAGKPMIQHVYERAKLSAASRVAIATDDSRIADAAASFGAEVVMTAATHESGSDRLNEAASKLGLAPETIIVNVQGDEPLIPPTIIDQVAGNLAAHPDYGMATLSCPLDGAAQLFEPSVVKVVADKTGRALYFSRASIPYSRKHFPATPSDLTPWQRHIGIYAYRVRFLQQFVSWAPAPIEQLESLEQLRALWNGAAIHVEPAREVPPAGVDTPEDLARLRELLR
ncbi:3-deoxy-manno-octulosonate cytidylyltransferase [Permianibacter sp. IMCC34836]|uniref:3-deoxy-manno-octulosonate cytidylyltransferase n=1 Tax=Permianibacter fluminis TaxID=2738515 RepID=UPI001557621B|nr:3-deoxy-manno-octulosonate cytidylyltransferase [Permianibacter fluminis]NQD37633.1 3-deoxy-manno-octulosonate cytidylyltransferase [Permianibacter fluminis]